MVHVLPVMVYQQIPKINPSTPKYENSLSLYVDELGWFMISHQITTYTSREKVLHKYNF